MTSPNNEPNANQPKIPSSNEPCEQDSPVGQSPTLSDEALAQQQEQYRRAYIEQLRRMSCPGCGDEGDLPF
ncbi:hypothetical protein SH449x_000172 [Pirellulaceae bacterium SH449]